MKKHVARWHLLFILSIKRDWLKIVLWITCLALFSSLFVPAFQEIGKGDGLMGMFETLQNPAMTSIVGPTPIKEAHLYTLGAMYAHEMLLFCGLFSMIISVLHVIRHTRKEEDLGLTELLRSFQVGRQANAMSVIAEVILINLVMGSLISGVMISFNAPTITVQGSLLFALSIALAGMMGAAIALVVAQVMPSSPSATGATMGIIGLLYIIRAATDIMKPILSTINPLSWIYLTYPYTENNWWPITLMFLFVITLVLIAFKLESLRDMGAGFLPEREGPPHAKWPLLSVPGLFIRLNRGIMISWFVAFLVLSASYGAIYGDMQGFLEGNELIKQMFIQAGVSIEQSFTSTIMQVLIALTAILPIAIINKLYTEEKNNRLSQLMGTKVKRSKLYWTTILIALGASMLSVLICSSGLGLSAIQAMQDEGMLLQDFYAIGFSLFPVILLVIGLSSLILGWLPEAGKLSYVCLAYFSLLNYFKGIINIPNWVLKTTPQGWLATIPMDAFNSHSYVYLSLIGLGLILVGYFGYIKRDMIEGA